MSLCQFTQSPCVSELRVGGKHQLFGDTIQAEYTLLEQDKRIEMFWKFKEWPEFARCTVRFEGTSSVDVTVTITGIPEHNSFGSFVHTESI